MEFRHMYILTELILSESFRRRVLDGEDDGAWRKLLPREPEYSGELVEKAEMLVRTIRFEEDSMAGPDAGRLRQRIHESLSASHLPERRSAPRYGKLLQYAAIAVVFSLLTVGLWIGSRRSSMEAPAETKPAWKTEVAGEGSIRKLGLPDGSQVILNAGSTIRYPSPFSERILYLEGEAYFQVKTAGGAAFRVSAGNVVTSVTGTSFNVNTRNGKVQVALVEGKVKVRDALSGEVLDLDPGKLAIVEKGGVFEVQDFDAGEVLGWQDHILVYRSESLGDIFRDLERIYGVRIVLRKELDLSKKYTGRFERELLDSILKGIGYVSGFSCKRSEDKIVIY